tara:strand:+ start:1153 stop:2001 length:849 start_codon:yes stop_codon:yes gene_type:complete
MSDKGLGKVIKKAIPKSILTKLGIKQKKVTPVELKKLKEKAKSKSENVKPIDNSTIAKLRNKLQNAMPQAQVKALRKKLNELEKGKKKQEVTKTLEKEKKKQVNLNTNQKTGLKTNKVVKGDETKDALKTAPLTQKELKDKGMVGGASEFRLQMASLKGAAKGLAEQLKKKKKLYDDLSLADKRGEKGQLLQNAMDGIKKKLKGKVPINTLRNAGLMNKGGLATPTANQTGLKKLPTAVRNKMGYMYGGGMAKKPRMSKMDYRKGGLVIMIGQSKPMKKGKK